MPLVAWEVYVWQKMEERKTTNVQNHRGCAREEEKTDQVIQIALCWLFGKKTLRQLKAVNYKANACNFNLFNETNHELNTKK